MADPLSVAASAAGLTSLGLEITRGLLAYISAVQGQDEETTLIRQKLVVLQTFLVAAQGAIQDIPTDLDQNLSTALKTALVFSKSRIENLQKYLQKCSTTSSAGVPSWKSDLSNAGRRAIYYFRKDTLKELEKAVDGLQQPIGLILNLLGM